MCDRIPPGPFPGPSWLRAEACMASIFSAWRCLYVKPLPQTPFTIVLVSFTVTTGFRPALFLAVLTRSISVRTCFFLPGSLTLERAISLATLPEVLSIGFGGFNPPSSLTQAQRSCWAYFSLISYFSARRRSTSALGRPARRIYERTVPGNGVCRR